MPWCVCEGGSVPSLALGSGFPYHDCKHVSSHICVLARFHHCVRHTVLRFPSLIETTHTHTDIHTHRLGHIVVFGTLYCPVVYSPALGALTITLKLQPSTTIERHITHRLGSIIVFVLTSGPPLSLVLPYSIETTTRSIAYRLGSRVRHAVLPRIGLPVVRNAVPSFYNHFNYTNQNCCGADCRLGPIIVFGPDALKPQQLTHTSHTHTGSALSSCLVRCTTRGSLVRISRTARGMGRGRRCAHNI